MTYVIKKTSAYPWGGHLNASNKAWSKAAATGGYGATLSRKWKGSDEGEVDLNLVPTSLILAKSRTSLPDLCWGAGGLLLCSPEMKEIIEALDPGFHQFWEVEIFRPGGKPFDAPLFGLHIRLRAQVINVDGSDLRVVKGFEKLGIAPSLAINSQTFDLCVDPSALPSRNLWWDPKTSAAALLCSDTLGDAVKAATLKTIPFKKCLEVT